VSQPAASSARSELSRPEDGPAERLGIAGSGTVACGLAACAAGHGGEVVLWARSEASAERARRHVAGACQKLERPEAVGQVRVEGDLAALSESTIAVEAVTEEEPVKRELLSSLGELLPAEALLATTTSSLSISSLAEASGRPARFLGLHVFNPVPRMRLVELCFTGAAHPDTRSRAVAFCEAIGKRAIEVPDEPGFVVNRLLFPYLFDAVRLLERSGMEPEAVDDCMKLGASHPMGPLELLDLVGIDVAEAIGEAIHADTGDPAHRPPGRIKQLVRQGRLGRKSGTGFYEYREG
jgi:3-hydroxyacyl-CoA dehydrogenase